MNVRNAGGRLGHGLTMSIGEGGGGRREGFVDKLMIGGEWEGKTFGTVVTILQIWRKDKMVLCEWEDGVRDRMTFQKLRATYRPRTIYVKENRS